MCGATCRCSQRDALELTDAEHLIRAVTCNYMPRAKKRVKS